jgi:hypothetical protein
MKRILISIAAGAVVGLALTAAASAQSGQATQSTPKSWSYELRDGKPVKRGNETRNPDGSWRKETPAGRCTTVEEKSAAGVYRKFSECPKT